MTASSATTQFGYDIVSGLPNIVAEYGLAASTPGAGGLAPALRRYVFGAGGEPLVQYEGSGTSSRNWLHADERGSIIAVSNGNGEAAAINSYDEYGIPAAGNYGRFQYTGQVWMPELGLYYYRNRIYSPTLGRFMQTDPIGFAGGMNSYAYVQNDPVNLTDPSGLCTQWMAHVVLVWDVLNGGWTKKNSDKWEETDPICTWLESNRFSGNPLGEGESDPEGDTIVITAQLDTGSDEAHLILAQSSACLSAYTRCQSYAEFQHDNGAVAQSHGTWLQCRAHYRMCLGTSLLSKIPQTNVHGLIIFPNGDRVETVPGRPDRFVPSGRTR